MFNNNNNNKKEKTMISKKQKIKKAISDFEKVAKHYKKDIELYSNTIAPNPRQLEISTRCYKKLQAEIKLLEDMLNNQESA